MNSNLLIIFPNTYSPKRREYKITHRPQFQGSRRQWLEQEMATHSSVLAWRIPGTGEPGGLPSMGSHRVGHDWIDLAAAAAAAGNSDNNVYLHVSEELHTWDLQSPILEYRIGNKDIINEVSFSEREYSSMT